MNTAHLGMNTEYTGPIEVWGPAEFPQPASGMSTANSSPTPFTPTA